MSSDPHSAADSPSGGPAAPPRIPITLKPLGEGIGLLSTGGEPVWVIMTPEAWRKIEATIDGWQRVFRWTIERLDTATLEQLTEEAELAVHLATLSGPHGQPASFRRGRTGRRRARRGGDFSTGSR